MAQPGIFARQTLKLLREFHRILAQFVLLLRKLILIRLVLFWFFVLGLIRFRLIWLGFSRFAFAFTISLALSLTLSLAFTLALTFAFALTFALGLAFPLAFLRRGLSLSVFAFGFSFSFALCLGGFGFITC